MHFLCVCVHYRVSADLGQNLETDKLDANRAALRIGSTLDFSLRGLCWTLLLVLHAAAKAIFQRRAETMEAPLPVHCARDKGPIHYRDLPYNPLGPTTTSLLSVPYSAGSRCFLLALPL